MGNLLDGHHPKQTITFSHYCINETWTNVSNCYATTVLISFLTQSFHVVNLVGFSRTIGRCHWFAT